jgi:hypothetical protein
LTLLMDGWGALRNTPILHSPRDIPSPLAIDGAYARMRQVPHPPFNSYLMSHSKKKGNFSKKEECQKEAVLCILKALNSPV